MDQELSFVELKNVEASRTYVYPDGSRYRVEGVTHICTRKSGSHRLNTVGGLKVLVQPGWIAIEFDMAEWSL